MEQPLPFHQRLRLERVRRGWSQAELAERVEISVKTITRWENGENLPQPYHRRLFSEIFDISLEELGLVGLAAQPGQADAIEERPHEGNREEVFSDNSSYERYGEQAIEGDPVANPQIAETPEIFTLKEARLDRGWTQTQLASMIGVSDRAYRAWENGDAYPSDLPLRRLAKVFGKKPEELGLEKKPAQSKTSLTYATLSQALQELVERNTHWAEAGLRTDAEKEQMVDMIRQLLLEIEAGRVEKVAERFNQVMLVPGGQSD